MTRTFLIATFLLGTTALCLAQTAPQSLGDVARQNKKGKKAAIVLNDDNMRRTATGPAPEASAPKSSASSAEAKKTGSDQFAGPQPGAGQVADLEKKVASYKAQQEGWKHSAEHYQELLASETNEFRRQMYQDALSNDQKNAAAFQQKKEQAEAELAKARESSSRAAKEPSSTDAKPASDQSAH
jgi:hypothetical protein